MSIIEIEERRTRPLLPRAFERRASNTDDFRVIRKLNDLGEKKVREFMHKGLLGRRTAVATRWLKRNHENSVRVVRDWSIRSGITAGMAGVLVGFFLAWRYYW